MRSSARPHIGCHVILSRRGRQEGTPPDIPLSRLHGPVYDRSMRHAMPGFCRELSPAIQGALWMSAATAAFAVMITLVRYLSQSLDPLQVVFFRNLFGVAVLSPWFLRQGRGSLRTERFHLHLLRAAVGLVAMTLWFTTLAALPL